MDSSEVKSLKIIEKSTHVKSKGKYFYEYKKYEVQSLQHPLLYKNMMHIRTDIFFVSYKNIHFMYHICILF